MSLRTELEELVEWISDVSAEPEPVPTEPLIKDAWESVKGALDRAADFFEKAAVKLESNKQAPALIEVARDLAYEANGLSLRAHILQRRAPQVPPAQPPETTLPAMKLKLAEVETEVAETKDKLEDEKKAHKRAKETLKETRAENQDMRAMLSAEQAAEVATRAAERAKTKAEATEEPKDTPPPPPTPAKAIEKAEGSIETALKNFGDVEHPDAVAKTFEEELDVLAEMALSLRQQCERLQEGQPEVER
jgi:chromosome segregation ATPase